VSASWYREGIQFMDDVKKNGSMLYLNTRLSEQVDEKKILHTLCLARARQVMTSDPQTRIALGYFLVAANHVLHLN
jgi:hypothetical protein